LSASAAVADYALDQRRTHFRHDRQRLEGLQRRRLFGWLHFPDFLVIGKWAQYGLQWHFFGMWDPDQTRRARGQVAVGGGMSNMTGLVL
jgi:hypothetical protein